LSIPSKNIKLSGKLKTEVYIIFCRIGFAVPVMLEPEDHDPDVEDRDDDKLQGHSDTHDKDKLLVGCWSVEERDGLLKDVTVATLLRKILEVRKQTE
jgi:hypothetical protein